MWKMCVREGGGGERERERGVCVCVCVCVCLEVGGLGSVSIRATL